MAKFQITETIHSERVYTVRLGDTGAANLFTDADVGKPVKLVGSGRYELCAVGDAIEGVVSSIESSTYDGYTIGGIYRTGIKAVTFDGAEADGTGDIEVGDYVVAAAPPAKGAVQTGPLKVRKATAQDDAASAAFKARVISLGDANTGAAGTVGYIEFI